MGASPVFPARLVRFRDLVAAVVAASIVFVCLTGFAWTERSVTVVVDGEPCRVQTRGRDVSAALRASGIEVVAADVVSPAPDAPLRDGMTIVVRRAIPVRVLLGEREISLRVVGSTVADALVAAGLDPASGIEPSPPLTATLVPGMAIRADEVFARFVEAESDVAFGTVTVSDPMLAEGVKEVVRRGVEGRVLRVHRVLVSGGVEGSRALVAERVIAPPVSQIVAVGTGKRSVTNRVSRGGTERGGGLLNARSAGRTLPMLSTAYSPGCDGVDWVTASGARTGAGVVAVDPAVIPLGTRLFVPGYGYAVAADTGGAIDGRRIDVFFESRARALAWGRRIVDVVVLD